MQDGIALSNGRFLPARWWRFEFARSGGPGGQHVQTADTAVRLRFDLVRCDVLAGSVKARIVDAKPGLITEDGELLIRVEATRSRAQNVEIALQRLTAIVEEGLIVPKQRRATQPTKASNTRRLGGKSKRAEVKSGRGRVRED
jgi:ribosome-associated protein